MELKYFNKDKIKSKYSLQLKYIIFVGVICC